MHVSKHRVYFGPKKKTTQALLVRIQQQQPRDIKTVIYFTDKYLLLFNSVFLVYTLIRTLAFLVWLFG